MADPYTISIDGSWPTEKYNIVPNLDDINPDYGVMDTVQAFKYFNNPITEIDSTVIENSYVFSNATYAKDLSGDDGINQIILTNNSTFSWSPSTIRNSNVGQFFNYFHIKIDDLNSSSGIFYGYLLYPFALHLRPVSARKVSDNSYQLVTSAVLLSSQYFYFNSNQSEFEAFEKHISYSPKFLKLSNTLNLIYSISSTETFFEKSLSALVPGNNSIRNSIFIDKRNVLIQPDTTVFYYDLTYPDIAEEGPKQLDTLDYGYNVGFFSSYVHRYNPSVSRTQIFQLAQSAIQPSLDLDAIENSILTCRINLDTNNLQIENYPVTYFINSRAVSFPMISATSGTNLKIRYISNIPSILNNPVHLTVNSFTVGGLTPTVQSLSSYAIPSSISNYDKVIWDTDYPPHYYSYILSTSTSNILNYFDTSNLNFSLSSGLIQTDTLSCKFLTILTDKFNSINLELSTFANKDIVLFRPINPNLPYNNPLIFNDIESENIQNLNVEFLNADQTFNTILSSFSAYYSPNDTDYYYYNLIYPTYINAASAKYFKVIYDKQYGEVDLTLRPQLSTSIGTNIDSLKSIRMKFAQGFLQQIDSNLFLKRIQEKENFVDLTVDHLNSGLVFPFINLKNSLISWNVNPLSSYIKINAINKNGQFITTIDPNSAIEFNDQSWTVRISGYGPETVTVTFSSQKYNNTDLYITDKNLFDLYSNQQFEIGLSKPIENLFDTKNIFLTALVKNGERTYPFTNNKPLRWTWVYDGNTNNLTVPITAYDTNNILYSFGTSKTSNVLSSINLKIKNPYNSLLLNTRPLIHNLQVNLFGNNPQAIGSYNVLITDYPEKSIFNTDFKVTYNNFPNNILSDTRNNQYVLTRPNNETNNYKFFANTDVIPRLTAQSICWVASSDNGSISSLSSTLFSEISSFSYNINNSDIKVTTVTLCALKAQLPNFSEKFDTVTTFTIYTEPSAIFNTPLTFNLYPPYMWGLSARYVTVLGQTNYTLASSPTAYDNTISNTQSFYVSANKNDFINYNYYAGNEKTFIKSTSSFLELIEIPLRNETRQASGLKITLVGHNTKYPEYNGTSYLANLNGTLTSKQFNIISETLPFNTTNTDISANFLRSPRVRPYNTINFTFSTSVTSIDLDDNRIISVDQFFTGENNLPLSSIPPQNVQEIYRGNIIVYTLSSALWKVNQFVPALKGEYDLFILSVGDPAIPLNISKYDFNTLKLYASGVMPVKIPSSTFDNYPTLPLTANCVAFWNFEELSGTRIDSTGNGYNLQLSSIPSLSSYPLSGVGIIGKSLSAGVTGIFLQTTGLDFGSDWTISYWEKLNVPIDQLRSKDAFITKSSDPSSSNPLSGITITTSPIIFYDNGGLYDQGILYNGPYVTPNQWNHIVLSAKNKFLSVYINNKRITDDIFLSDALVDYIAISNGYPLRINGQTRDVAIDAFGIWDRGLESADVYNLYNGGSAIQYPFAGVLDSYTGERDLWKVIFQNVSTTPSTLVAYSTTVVPEVYISSYFALTGQQIFIQFETPQNTQNVYISAYRTYFGETTSSDVEQESQVIFNTSFDDVSATVYHSYQNAGIYNLSFDVIYNTGEIKKINLESPITIYNEWPKYEQEKIRFLNETILNFGNEEENTWTLDQVNIQPNEYGDADIFNTAISRLYDNFEYLKFNSQTINTNSPTLFYGWLGMEEGYTARGIQWNTKDYGFFEWDKPNRVIRGSLTSTNTFFSDIISISEIKDHILVIDGTNFRAFSAGKIPQEVKFENIEDIKPLISQPISIDSFTDETGSYVYVCDSGKNKIYKFNLEMSISAPQINIQLVVGNFGKKEDANKFDSPTEIVYKNNFVYVLDYNNKCIKQYTSDLNWVYTYYIPDFESDQPESITIHPNPEISFVYVLSETNKVYIFDQFEETPFQTLILTESMDGQKVQKITFDEAGEFIYVVTTKYIYKYTLTGTYISTVDLPNSSNLNFSTMKESTYRSLLIGYKNPESEGSGIIKIQDVVQLFKVGDGLNKNYWSREQILINKNEFVEDINYNRSLVRLVQNIKTFRGVFDSKFVIATEQLPSGTVSYFTLTPISADDRPIFSSDIENENIGVGVNELHIPSVLNREFSKIYDALVILKDYLEVSDIRVQSGVNKGCFSPFCWSWKAMSCYNLSLPVIRICNINPITYVELENEFPVKYAPSTLWGTASSICCRDFKPLANP